MPAERFTLRAQAQGAKEFAANMTALKRGVRNRVQRKMISAGTRPVLAAAKAQARTVGRSNVLATSMIRKTKTYARSGTVVGVVGAAKGRGKQVPVWSWYKDRARTIRRYVKRYTVPANILHLVELGTKAHALGKGSKLARRRKWGMTAAVQHGHMHPGSAPHPVLGVAWAESSRPAEAAMIQAGIDGLRSELARLQVKKP